MKYCKSIFWPLLFAILSGVADSAMDKLQFHYSRSAFRKLGNETFWNPAVSWKNKWKEGNPALGEKYFGSSTFLVAFTDGWHLCKKLWLIFIFAAVVTYRPMRPGWPWRLIDFVLLYLAFTVTFEIFFSRVWA